MRCAIEEACDAWMLHILIELDKIHNKLLVDIYYICVYTGFSSTSKYSYSSFYYYVPTTQQISIEVETNHVSASIGFSCMT